MVWISPSILSIKPCISRAVCGNGAKVQGKETLNESGYENCCYRNHCGGQVNSLLHEYGEYIIGRMGLPYEKKEVNIISVVVDASVDKISALSGKLGKLPGVSAKALYSKSKGAAT